jgi:hypothetical protein
MPGYDLDGWEAKENAQKFWDASNMGAREIVSIIDRALKAEAALRDVVRKASSPPFDGDHEAALGACEVIARAALEGEVR